MRAILAALALASAGGTAFLFQQEGVPPPSRVTRAEALETAAAYVRHVWEPTAQNVFHAMDPDGIRVDTPDEGHQPSTGQKGWWRAGEKNVGIPYKWGGFDSPAEFDAGLREGRAAGDAYTAEKRRHLDDAVSRHAVGIDCSGFVSRCWRLPRSYSTRELPQLCRPLSDWSRLRPGDIFNKHNAHVRLFAGWADPERQVARVYEAQERVKINDIPLQQMVEDGYSAWRYRGISH